MQPDLSALYDESAPDEERVRAFQAVINSGEVWQLEGAMGRAAMALIDEGRCALGKNPGIDHWGNRVPTRSQVQAGTKGSVEYVEARGFSVLD